MRLTGYAKPYKPLCSAVIGWFSTAVIGAFLFRRAAKKRTTESATHRNSEDQNALITAVEN